MPLRSKERWLVMLSAYLVATLNQGVLNSYGALFDDIMTAFSSSRTETAVIFSAVRGIGLCSGLPIGILIHKFGPFVAGLGGSALCSLGLIASVFAKSIAHMVVCISVVYGIGYGCVLVSALTVVSQTFHGKTRLVMMSVHSTGAGVGGIIYPFSLRFLSDVYGFRGASLIVGSIMLNTVPLCILWKRVSAQHRDKFNKQTETGKTLSTGVDRVNKLETDGRYNYIVEQLETDEPVQSESLSRTTTFDDDTQHKTEMTENNHHDVKHGMKRPLQLKCNGQHKTVSMMNGEPLATDGTSPHIISSDFEADTNVSQNNQPYFGSDHDYRYTGKERETFSTHTVTTEMNGAPQVASSRSKQRHTMLKILKNKRFVIFTLGSVISNPCFIIVLAFVVDIFLDKGFTKEDASLGLTFWSVSNIIGRLLPGILLQNKHFPIFGVPVIVCLMDTILLIALNFTQTMQLSVFVFAMTGLAFGIAIASYSVITLTLVGQELLPSALGFLTFLCGLGNAVYGIGSGYLRDATSSYTVSLFSAAGMTTLSLILFCIAAAATNRKVQRQTPVKIFYVTKL